MYLVLINLEFNLVTFIVFLIFLVIRSFLILNEYGIIFKFNGSLLKNFFDNCILSFLLNFKRNLLLNLNFDNNK